MKFMASEAGIFIAFTISVSTPFLLCDTVKDLTDDELPTLATFPYIINAATPGGHVYIPTADVVKVWVMVLNLFNGIAAILYDPPSAMISGVSVA